MCCFSPPKINALKSYKYLCSASSLSLQLHVRFLSILKFKVLNFSGFVFDPASSHHVACIKTHTTDHPSPTTVYVPISIVKFKAVCSRKLERIVKLYGKIQDTSYMISVEHSQPLATKSTQKYNFITPNINK